MEQQLLTTQNLAVGYTHGRSEVTLLSDVNLSLHSGEMVALLGQNGAGKSTLLRALTCASKPLDGKVLLGDIDAAALTQQQRSKIIGLVSTERIASGGLTVTELVALGRQPHTGFLGRLSDSDHEAVEKAIADVGISHKSQSFMAELSDGERQKVMIAKAIAQETPIIVLDEPTAFLDAASRIEIMKLLDRLAHTDGKAILLTTHDISRSLLLADTLWIITADRKVVSGPAQEIIAGEVMNQVFTSQAVIFNPTTCDYESK